MATPSRPWPDGLGVKPPTADELAQVAVDPGRFVDAVRAALEAAASYRPPHLAVLRALEERLNAPTRTGLPDPLAPAMLALAHALYGENRAPWDEAAAALRRRYLQASGAEGPADPREADAAVLRWRALLSLLHEDRDLFRDWCKEQPPLLHPRRPLSQGRHRAAALVYTAAGVALWREDSRPPACDERYVPRMDLLLSTTQTNEGRVGDWGVGDHAIDVIWTGLFDPRLVASKDRLSALAQQFLSFLLTRVGSPQADPTQPCRVRADSLAHWAQVDPRPVRAAFTRADAGGSPAHELLGQRAVLPDWRWAGLAHAEPLVLPWLAAPPCAGVQDGGPWLEVTVGRAVWPYLRRLCLCLDHTPLATANED